MYYTRRKDRKHINAKLSVMCVGPRSLNGVETACEWMGDRACLDGEIWLAESIQDQRLWTDLTLRICRDPLDVYKKYTKKHATMIEARKGGGNLISTRTIFELERRKVIYYWYDKSAVESFGPPRFCLSPNSNLRRQASRPASNSAWKLLSQYNMLQSGSIVTPSP